LKYKKRKKNKLKKKVMLDLSTNEFLTLDEVKQRASSIFSKTAAPTVSDKFTHIPTFKVIEDMSQLGWNVVDAKQVKARTEGTKGFQKHLVVFRNPDVVINGVDGDTVFPQILLTNSNDGKNAFTFTAGLFRMVCENGLVISTEQFNDVKMRHMGYTFEELQAQIREMVEQLPLTVESMNKMKQIQLNEEQAKALAKKALTTRFTEEQVKNVQVDLDELLKPTRDEDKGTDLWSVFNVIQEKILNGDFNYISGVKQRKARKVKNFKQDMEINQKLFAMAAEFTAA
jgi:hypothetical protein